MFSFFFLYQELFLNYLCLVRRCAIALEEQLVSLLGPGGDGALKLDALGTSQEWVLEQIDIPRAVKRLLGNTDPRK